MLRERVQKWTAEKWAEGHAEGQVELMRRMAARKFGGETANRLAERLQSVHDPERLAEIGEWLFECASGEELLERLERAHAFLPDGQEPERQLARWVRGLRRILDLAHVRPEPGEHAGRPLHGGLRPAGGRQP